MARRLLLGALLAIVTALVMPSCGSAPLLGFTADAGDQAAGAGGDSSARPTLDAATIPIGPLLDASLGAGSQDSGGWAWTDGGWVFTGDAGAWVEQSDGGWALGGLCEVANCDVACPDGGTTTVSGTVYAPNGTLPIYNALVYVPDGPLGSIDAGLSCACPPVTGYPLATALSDATGRFVLTNVPVGKNIPLVVQLGKWRRETTIATVTACVDNALADPNLTRLPRNQAEGSMPHVALTTGACDNMGCMLPKIGIDHAEFGTQADGRAKAINVYTNGVDGLPVPPTTPNYGLWSNAALLSSYDIGVFSCNCEESLSNGDPALAVVTDYLDRGGRIFTTDFQYTWYRYSPDPKLRGIGSIPGGAPGADSWFNLNTGTPKGAALARWLVTVFPTTGTYGQVTCDRAFDNFTSLNATATSYATSSPGPDPRVITVNTPAGLPAAQQCGKGVHIDAHVDVNSTDVVGCMPDDAGANHCYPETCTTPLTQGEALFAFFFFDLASCIEDEPPPPVPPPPPPAPH